MTSHTPSTETCTSCQGGAASQDTAADSQASRVTYDEGKGIKNRVVLSGPLSEVLAQQLSVVFGKQEFTTDGATPAAEAYAQDVAVAKIFKDAAAHPDNEVILTGFDVVSIKEHLERLAKERPTQSDLESYTLIPAVVADADTLLESPHITDVAINSDDEIIIAEAPVVGNTQGASRPYFLKRSAATDITQALRTDADTFELRMAKDEPSLQDKVEAIERLYAGRVKAVHRSPAAFVRSLIERQKA